MDVTKGVYGATKVAAMRNKRVRYATNKKYWLYYWCGRRSELDIRLLSRTQVEGVFVSATTSS